MNITNESFPILWLNKVEGSLGTFRSNDEMSTSTKSAFAEKGFYFCIQLIAHDGSTYQVDSIGAKVISNPNSFKTLLWRLAGGELYKVELNLRFDGELSLDGLINAVKEILLDDYEYWDSDGQLERLVKQLDRARSIFEVINLIDKRYHGEF